MRKTLLTLSLSLMLGGGVLAAIAASSATAQPANARRPMELAQGRQPGGRFERRVATPEERSVRRAALCGELHARAAGRLAEMEIRLNLTAAQHAGFNRWRDIRLDAAKRRADACATAPVGPRSNQGGRGPANAQANPAERLARREQMLRQRLADLQAERPALEALYNSLTPEQRQKFTPLNGPRGGMGRGVRQGRMTMMLRDRRDGGPRGNMGGGMRGGPGPMGPNGPGMAPPPPPPQ